MSSVVGIDEVGRGPIAGPLCVCALRISNACNLMNEGLIRDSKKLSAKKRIDLFTKIKEEKERGSLDFVLIYISSSKIDAFGMAVALKKAVAQALEKLTVGRTEAILLDGALKAPEKYLNQKTIIRDDESERAIAFASIAAKVSRDRKMISFAKKFPDYGFEKHKGYGTRFHYKAIEEFGLTSIHRRSFCKNLDIVDIDSPRAKPH